MIQYPKLIFTTVKEITINMITIKTGKKTLYDSNKTELTAGVTKNMYAYNKSYRPL